MHATRHRIHRRGALRASVMGANDGMISTASIVVGVVAAQSSHRDILIAGVASVVAGALSMAAGEYVSVSSQRDVEQTELAVEKASIEEDSEGETRELQDIYVRRGLRPSLAKQVAQALMEADALGAHARDDIGIVSSSRAQPFKAAVYSALCFVAGAMAPLLAAVIAPHAIMQFIVIGITLCGLLLLGGLAAYLGGASIYVGAGRVFIWGGVAMSLTSLIGEFVGGIV